MHNGWKVRSCPLGCESADVVATYWPSCDLRHSHKLVTPPPHPNPTNGVPSCANCGRKIAPAERYCTGCGEPSSQLLGSKVAAPSTTAGNRPGALRTGVPDCPKCGQTPAASDLNCPQCGTSLEFDQGDSRHNCPSCGTLATDETARFCASCGSPLSAEIRPEITAPRGTPVVDGVVRLTLLDSMGDIKQVIPLKSRSTLTSDLLGLQVSDSMIGGNGATIAIEGSAIRIEPVGLPRALFVFINKPTRLEDGDVLLLGSQVIRCRNVRDDAVLLFGADRGIEQVGSALPAPDLVVLEQIREDGRVRDTRHLWAGCTVAIGRDQGDWTFSYDPTMSARHATVTCDADGAVTVRDVGSTNGVALAVRTPQLVSGGQRVSLGGQMMRVDLA